MTHDNRKICPLCAWRGSCAKRFSMGDDATLHCPDFSRDVTLGKDDDAGTTKDESEDRA